MNRRIACAALLALISLGGCSQADEDAKKAPTSQQVAGSPGKQVFDRWCLQCHGDGPRYPGTASLAVKYGKDMPAALEKRQDLTPETVALFVRQGVSVMPPFRKTEITDAELASLGAYLAHLPEDKALAPKHEQKR